MGSHDLTSLTLLHWSRRAEPTGRGHALGGELPQPHGLYSKLVIGYGWDAFASACVHRIWGYLEMVVNITFLGIGHLVSPKPVFKDGDFFGHPPNHLKTFTRCRLNKHRENA